MTRAAVVLLALLAVGCSSYPPTPIFAGDTCFRCRRTIGEVRMAAEIVDTGGRAFKFKTAGCMAKFLSEQAIEIGEVFVTDYRTGRIIKASAASFVPATIVDGKTKSLDYMAFSATTAAEDAALREKTKIVTWTDVLAAAKSTTP